MIHIPFIAIASHICAEGRCDYCERTFGLMGSVGVLGRVKCHIFCFVFLFLLIFPNSRSRHCEVDFVSLFGKIERNCFTWVFFFPNDIKLF